MIKAIITIDCDMCRRPLETAAVCDELDLVDSYAWDLGTYAGIHGWEVDEERTKYICESCSDLWSQISGGGLPDTKA